MTFFKTEKHDNKSQLKLVNCQSENITVTLKQQSEDKSDLKFSYELAEGTELLIDVPQPLIGIAFDVEFMCKETCLHQETLMIVNDS